MRCFRLHMDLERRFSSYEAFIMKVNLQGFRQAEKFQRNTLSHLWNLVCQLKTIIPNLTKQQEIPSIFTPNKKTRRSLKTQRSHKKRSYQSKWFLAIPGSHIVSWKLPETTIVLLFFGDFWEIGNFFSRNCQQLPTIWKFFLSINISHI